MELQTTIIDAKEEWKNSILKHMLTYVILLMVM
jgi:hypothetical protein